MRVLIALNSTWNLLNFRSGLIKALIAEGHEVLVAAPADQYVSALNNLGCRFLNIPVASHGINPVKDFHLFMRFVDMLRNEQPNVLLAYTVKPNVYGSMAAHILGIPVINNISGLGSVFIRGGWLAWLVRVLYRVALFRSRKVYFQNPDDKKLFLSLGLCRYEQSDLLPGSGVDIVKFSTVVLPCLQKTEVQRQNQFSFLLVARMIKDKGVVEYVRAARQLKARFPMAEFAMLGSLDIQSPSAITGQQIQAWVDEGVVRYWGASGDVRVEIARADCVVLPSYREGTPRTLLEAAAMGRPLIATDVPGCREVVVHGFNGLLCLPQEAEDLALCMAKILGMRPEKLEQWGRNSRELVQQRFDERIVIDHYLRALNALE